MDADAPHTATGRATARQWAGLGLLAAPLFVLAIDSSVLFLAAPTIAIDLDTSPVAWLWILDIYGFLIAGFLITMGALGDRIGHRRLLVVGAVVFAAASTMCAFAPSAGTLIAGRALLGLAGATLMPSTLAIIKDLFLDERQRGFAIGVWMTTFSVGIASGPLIGGVLVDAFWWGAVFLVAVPIMALVPLLAHRLLPASPGSSAVRVDALSALLSVVAVLAVVHAVKEVASGESPWESIGSAALGLGAGAWFVHRQRTADSPMVDLQLFGQRRLVLALAILVLAILSATAVNFLLPQLLQYVNGLPTVMVGLYTAPVALAAIVGSLAAARLASLVGAGRVIAGGAAIALTGLLLLTGIDSSTPTWHVVLLCAITIVGVSPIPILATDMVLGAAPKERSGSAAALTETGGELGVALGVTIFGLMLTVGYRSSFTIDADALSTALREASAQSIAAAESSSYGLPAKQAEILDAAADTAFVHGFTNAAALGCLLVTALLLCALAFARTPPVELAEAVRDAHGGTSTP